MSSTRGCNFLDPTLLNHWSSFFAQDGCWRLWCRQAVGYAGLHCCSYLIFATDKEGVAQTLLRYPKIVGDCIPYNGFPSSTYTMFIQRHKETLEEDIDYRGFSLPGTEGPFMEALKEEPPEKVLQLLCADEDWERNFTQLVELKPADFPDLNRCVELACKRREYLSRVLSGKKSLKGVIADHIAGFFYPSGPSAAIYIMQEEGLDFFQVCTSSGYCEASSVFLLARGHGRAIRRFLTDERVKSVCEPMIESTKLFPDRGTRCQTLSLIGDEHISEMFFCHYIEGEFRTLTALPVQRCRIISQPRQPRKPSVLQMLMTKSQISDSRSCSELGC